ncbi:uncharacterized protein LOC123686497 [Harmonia axyridis]|uniref:uncharacterized protein LOC123686497 n=1 Tax=Harmonia axyridis TaxID=115357 RepID=UPI001E27859C|nr:uncharacterized protein LOC123686497 [Harmonia axyridis]
MWSFTILVFTVFVYVVFSKSLPDRNNSTVQISEYAKVAHWGSARSSQGQKPWTQRSEGSISYGQNLKNHRSYDTSLIPAVGEVQERFNPKPYFVYGTSENQNDVSSEIVKGPASTNYNSPVYLPTVPPSAALPVPVLPTVEPKPHEDPYTSPYSSYNPPSKESEAEESYNPSHNQMDISHDEDSYGTNQEEVEDDFPPRANSMKNNAAAEEDMKYQSDDDYSHNSYFPVSDDSHSVSDHHVKSNGMKEVILDHPPPGYEEKEPPMAPPPSEHFPHYLYEDEHHDHHVYHEVEKPKEQKRVSKPQYSYYYIGRKLWYIPLYFSVYFIIYVTFLILKSIARHKIQFKHDFVDHHSRESRQLSDSTIISEDLNDVHRNVAVALENGKKKFPLVVM